uniref:Immunoglobulin V-set domain-containing protein n=1 Tax=Cyprinus carpio TaxID=7962 RepID=A0A8C2D024_CYPCA
MFHRFWLCLCLWRLDGVFGVDAVKMVTEGDSVTLESGVTEIQTDDLIAWSFGRPETLIALINKENVIFSSSDGLDGRFRDRLKLDHQTGSLIITNTRTTDSGLYQITIRSTKQTTNRFVDIKSTKTTTNRFSVSVYGESRLQCHLCCKMHEILIFFFLFFSFLKDLRHS